MCWSRMWPCGLVLLAALMASCASEPLPSPGWREEPAEILALPGEGGPLSAGAARVSLDPPFASPMAGYVGASWFRLRELRDPLFVRAIVIDQNGHRFAFVSLDRVLIPPSFRSAVEGRAETRRARLSGWIVAGTHAHTAPGGFLEAWPAEWLGVGTYDPLLLEHLVDRTARAISEAAATLAPVQLEAASLRLPEAHASWVSFNRRDPGAPADPELDVLRFRSGAAPAASRTVASISRFAAHPTLIPFYLRRASGDYPGVFCRTLEALDGGVALFAPGPCADLAAGAPADFAPTGWERRVERIGRRLALEASHARPGPTQSEANVPFAHASVRVRLPPREPWHVPFVGREIASHYPEVGTFQAVRLGDVLILSFPGEMSSELGESIRRAALERTGARHALLWTLADHYIGYAFTKASLEKGGKSQHLSAYGPELGDLIENRMTELAARAWGAWKSDAPAKAPGQDAGKSKDGKKSEP